VKIGACKQYNLFKGMNETLSDFPHSRPDLDKIM